MKRRYSKRKQVKKSVHIKNCSVQIEDIRHLITLNEPVTSTKSNENPAKPPPPPPLPAPPKPSPPANMSFSIPKKKNNEDSLFDGSFSLPTFGALKFKPFASPKTDSTKPVENEKVDSSFGNTLFPPYGTSSMTISSSKQQQKVPASPLPPPLPPPLPSTQHQIQTVRSENQENVNLREFKNLFVPKKNIPPTTKIITTAKKSVLSPIRSIQLSVFVKNVNDNNKIIRAIQQFNTTELSIDVLQKIVVLKPLSIECDKIKEMAVEGIGTPESVLVKIMEIPHYSNKIDMLGLYANITDLFDIIGDTTKEMIDVCRFLINNDHLKKLFNMIKTYIKEMKGLNAQDGIVSYLWQLKRIKSTDKKMSLLDYIVRNYIRTTRMNLSPMPELASVKKVSSVDLNAIGVHIKNLQAQLGGKAGNAHF